MQSVTRIIATVSFVCLFVVAAPVFSHAGNVTDETITRNVQQALKELNKNISVKTVDGKVFLRGQVTYAEDVNEAERLARRVPGVRSINTDIAHAMRRESN
jgi:Predicted periplasmic or secreted lipoprotein